MQIDTTSAWGDRLQDSFAQIFGQIVPAVIGASIIIFAGYLLAKVLERLTERLLKKLGLNRMLQRGGVIQAVERSGTHVNPTRVIANLVFWFVMFAVILLAANALGLDTLANVMGTLVSYVPSVIAAIVIILVGIILGGFVEGFIAASAGAVHGGRSLARLGRASVILLSIFMALQELGIATEIVTTAFAILFGAVALAMALSFGLGNRELAGEITREWYERYKRERADTLERERRASVEMDAEDDDDDDDDDEKPRGPSDSPPQPV
ncbi:MAG TPA: mechanosensitive ion channel [Gemmatimonadaceae bacterium]|nr:mechanosensitive ion channel [Gemmatimonadaceae bacterium]